MESAIRKLTWPIKQNNRPSPYLDENASLMANRKHNLIPMMETISSGRCSQTNRRLRQRSQTTFAFIAGPLSLFVGGMLLGTIGAICAFLAYRKLHSLAQKSNDTASIARGMLKSTRTALIICLVAVTLNAVSFVIMFPVIEQMLQSGDFASIAGNMSAGTAAGTSTWG